MLTLTYLLDAILLVLTTISGLLLFYFSVTFDGTWNVNIRFVILDWRERSAGRSIKVERSASLSNEGRDLQVTQADMSCLFFARHTISQKSPRHWRKISANTLWLYSYYTQSSPSKNKDINYIFIYLGVLRYLSSDAIYYTRESSLFGFYY